MTSKERDTRSSELLIAWRSGDASARDALLELNMDLVRIITSQYVKKYGCDWDDTYGIAQLALVESAEGLRKSGKDKPRGYFVKSIKNAILSELRKEWKLPRNLKKNRRNVNDLGEEEESQTVDLEFEESETIEELYASCETLRDREIVELKSEDSAVREIAKTVKVSESTVYERLNKIKRRYRERSEASYGLAT